MVVAIAQLANELRGERIVEQRQDGLAAGTIACGHSPVRNMVAGVLRRVLTSLTKGFCDMRLSPGSNTPKRRLDS